jgi:hypothetical protein
VAESVLTVVFRQGPEFRAQERHVARGAFFLPAPRPPPEPLAVLVLRVESPSQEIVELPVRVVQISPTHVSLALLDLDAARTALAPLFHAARSAPASEGSTWVFWGRPDTAAEPLLDLPREVGAAIAMAPSAAREIPTPAPEAPAAAPIPEAPAAGDEKLLYDQIRAMTPPEKMQLALHGDRTARFLLLKDLNKNVQTFLLQNARITVEEVRTIAGYRQAIPDVLVAIAAHREWSQNQGVLAALVRNPKTPPITAVALLERIAPAELRRLAKSSEVPRPVQAAARKKVTEGGT